MRESSRVRPSVRPLNKFNLLLPVGRLLEGQRQRGAASPGWGEPRGPVHVGAQRQACQGRHLLADGSNRPGLLETQLPHLGE